MGSTITPKRLQVETFVRTKYVDIAAPGATIEDVVSPNYWAHVASSLKVHDEIDIIGASGDFDITLRVVRRVQDFVDFRILREWRANVAEPAQEKVSAGPISPKRTGSAAEHWI